MGQRNLVARITDEAALERVEDFIAGFGVTC